MSNSPLVLRCYNHSMDERVISSLPELEDYAKNVLEEVSALPRSGAVVLALQGDLGAGKTAFVKALAKQLGVVEHVTSPTFVIMKSYEGRGARGESFKTLVHIDAYRLESAHELEVLGWNELIADPDALIAIEWPEKVPGAMPAGAVWLEFKHVSASGRRVKRVSS